MIGGTSKAYDKCAVFKLSILSKQNIRARKMEVELNMKLPRHIVPHLKCIGPVGFNITCCETDNSTMFHTLFFGGYVELELEKPFAYLGSLFLCKDRKTDGRQVRELFIHLPS